MFSFKIFFNRVSSSLVSAHRAEPTPVQVRGNKVRNSKIFDGVMVVSW
jgi:hypothetical protein